MEEGLAGVGVASLVALLDEIVKGGARGILAMALEAGVAAYIETCTGEVDENSRRLVVRNGHHTLKEVLTAAESHRGRRAAGVRQTHR